ncbi:MAG: TIGR04255 family protein [Bacteroidia bacterium]
MKEAVISLFLKEPLPNPECFESLKPILNFDQIEYLNFVSFPFKFEKGTLSAKPPLTNDKLGFKLIAFKNGLIDHVLQGLNNPDHTILSFHTLMYKSWTDFLAAYKNKVSKAFDIINGNPIYAVSLHYIDEFMWKSKGAIPQQAIFKKSNKVLPDDFYNSINSEFLRTTETDQGKYDRLHVKVNSKELQPMLIISHNLTQILPEAEPIRGPLDKDVLESLELAHTSNKETLRQILKLNVQNKIGLND